MFPRASVIFNQVNMTSKNSTVNLSTYNYKKISFHLTDMMSTAAHNIEEATKIANEKILSQISIHQANTIASELLLTNEFSFRDVSQKTIQTQMQTTTPHVAWGALLPSGGVVPAFRSVTANGSYGLPDYTFTKGMSATIFNTRSGSRIIVPASVVSYVQTSDAEGNPETKFSIENRYDMFGFVFGPNISTSLNANHVLAQRYALPHLRYQNDRYIYLIALREGFSTGDAIYNGSGYIRNREAGLQGKKGVSSQEDACEIAAGVYISNEQFLGVRKIATDGTLTPFEMNPNANQEMFAETLKYLDTKIFLEAKTLEEIKYLEALMLSDPNKVESYMQQISSYQRLDTDLKRQIQLDAINSNNPESSVCGLLREQVSGNKVLSEGSKYHFSLFSQSVNYKKSVQSGVLGDAKEIAFHNKKAATEEELKNRAIKAEKIKSQQPTVDTTPVLKM